MPVAVSDRFRAQLGPDGSPQWVTTIEWSNDGGREWRPSTFVTGAATNSRTSQIRWTCSVTVTDVAFGPGGIDPFTTRIRARRGIRYSIHEQPELVGVGVYEVQKAKRSEEDDALIVITGQSFEGYLKKSRIYRPRTIRAASADVMLEALVHEVLPKASIDWHPSIDRNMLLPQLVSVTDRWGTISGGRDARSISQALGAEFYPDGDGIWKVWPVPTLADVPMWEIEQGEDGVSLGLGEELSNEGVCNVEVVVGTAGGNVIGPGIAKDTDPSSPTYVGRSVDDGGFGEVAAEEYQSQMITNQLQCETVARSRLANRLGLRRVLDLGFLHNPLMRAGDVGVVHGFGERNKIILDTVPIDLSSTPGPMQCQTRTTQTRYAGQISDIGDDTGGAGELI